MDPIRVAPDGGLILELVQVTSEQVPGPETANKAFLYYLKGSGWRMKVFGQNGQPLSEAVSVQILDAQTSDPSGIPGKGQIYAKVAGGKVQLFYAADDGTAYQITPLTATDPTAYHSGDVNPKPSADASQILGSSLKRFLSVISAAFSVFGTAGDAVASVAISDKIVAIGKGGSTGQDSALVNDGTTTRFGLGTVTPSYIEDIQQPTSAGTLISKGVTLKDSPGSDGLTDVDDFLAHDDGGTLAVFARISRIVEKAAAAGRRGKYIIQLRKGAALNSYLSIDPDSGTTDFGSQRLTSGADPTGAQDLVTLNFLNGRAPAPSGLSVDVLHGDGTYGPASDDDVTIRQVRQIFRPDTTKIASDGYYTPAGSGTPVYVNISGKSFLEYPGQLNTPGQDFPSAPGIYPIDTALDFKVQFRTGALSGDLTTTRIWVALENHAVETYQLDDPHQNKQVGFRFSNSTAHGQPGTDTHFMAYVSNGTSSTVVDTGITPVLDTDYIFLIDFSTAGHVKFFINGTQVADISTNVPTTGTWSHRITVESADATVRKIRVGKFMFRYR